MADRAAEELIDQGASELVDLDVDRVDGVDSPATRRKWLIMKSQEAGMSVNAAELEKATVGLLDALVKAGGEAGLDLPPAAIDAVNTVGKMVGLRVTLKAKPFPGAAPPFKPEDEEEKKKAAAAEMAKQATGTYGGDPAGGAQPEQPDVFKGQPGAAPSAAVAAPATPAPAADVAKMGPGMHPEEEDEMYARGTGRMKAMEEQIKALTEAHAKLASAYDGLRTSFEKSARPASAQATGVPVTKSAPKPISRDTARDAFAGIMSNGPKMPARR